MSLLQAVLASADDLDARFLRAVWCLPDSTLRGLVACRFDLPADLREMTGPPPHPETLPPLETARYLSSRVEGRLRMHALIGACRRGVGDEELTRLAAGSLDFDRMEHPVPDRAVLAILRAHRSLFLEPLERAEHPARVIAWRLKDPVNDDEVTTLLSTGLGDADAARGLPWDQAVRLMLGDSAPVVDAIAAYLLARLGTGAARWEMFESLAPTWDGSIGMLLDAVAVFVPDQTAGSWPTTAPEGAPTGPATNLPIASAALARHGAECRELVRAVRRHLEEHRSLASPVLPRFPLAPPRRRDRAAAVTARPDDIDLCLALCLAHPCETRRLVQASGDPVTVAGLLVEIAFAGAPVAGERPVELICGWHSLVGLVLLPGGAGRLAELLVDGVPGRRGLGVRKRAWERFAQQDRAGLMLGDHRGTVVTLADLVHRCARP